MQSLFIISSNFRFVVGNYIRAADEACLKVH